VLCELRAIAGRIANLKTQLAVEYDQRDEVVARGVAEHHLTWREIGEALGVSPQSAHSAHKHYEASIEALWSGAS
jgi:hypothetical protein